MNQTLGEKLADRIAARNEEAGWVEVNQYRFERMIRGKNAVVFWHSSDNVWIGTHPDMTFSVTETTLPAAMDAVERKMIMLPKQQPTMAETLLNDEPDEPDDVPLTFAEQCEMLAASGEWEKSKHRASGEEWINFELKDCDEGIYVVAKDNKFHLCTYEGRLGDYDDAFDAIWAVEEHRNKIDTLNEMYHQAKTDARRLITGEEDDSPTECDIDGESLESDYERGEAGFFEQVRAFEETSGWARVDDDTFYRVFCDVVNGHGIDIHCSAVTEAFAGRVSGDLISISHDINKLADTLVNAANAMGGRDEPAVNVEASGKRKSCEPGCCKRTSHPINENHESILDEAARITSTDRRASYGHPRTNHERIALLWNYYLQGMMVGKPADHVVELNWRHVIHMLMLMKLSRDEYNPKRDNRVDLAGYSNCLDVGEDK